jgi:hypothetical protein
MKKRDYLIIALFTFYHISLLQSESTNETTTEATTTIAQNSTEDANIDPDAAGSTDEVKVDLNLNDYAFRIKKISVKTL